MLKGSEYELNDRSFTDEELNEDEEVQSLYQCAYGGLDGFTVSCKADDAEEKAPKHSVTDDSIKAYTKSMENMQKNGVINAETVDSFKRATKALKDFDLEELQKELAKAAKNEKVNALSVMMHLKEVLEKNGWNTIAFQPDATTGSVILKNDKTETYFSMQFSKEKDKQGAEVKIYTKK